MRALIFTLLAACYSPALDVCTVSCGSDSPCPNELACGSDNFCHASDESAACTATLTVTTNNQGDAHVVSDPAAIDCSTHDPTDDCSGTWPLGTTITLTARFGGSTHFGGWTGDPCAGSGSTMCKVTLSGPVTVQANFH